MITVNTSRAYSAPRTIGKVGVAVGFSHIPELSPGEQDTDGVEAELELDPELDPELESEPESLLPGGDLFASSA